MPACSICGEAIPAGSRTCAMCGSSADEPTSPASGLFLEKPARPLPAKLPPGCRYCPGCYEIYGPAFTDSYCKCGTELLSELPTKSETIPMAALAAPPTAALADVVPLAPLLDEEPMAPFDGDLPPMAPLLDDVPMAPFAEAAPPPEDPADTPVKIRLVKPPTGTPSIVLYGPDKQPLQYFALNKDATLIGRLDAVAGVFPDIDLDQWFDRATIRKISRQHALILRTRASKTFVLRPLIGNTGTQLETEMLEAQQDYPLQPGHRIILGGTIRLKFEIA